MAIDYQEVLRDLHAEEVRLKGELDVVRGMIPGAEYMARRFSPILIPPPLQPPSLPQPPPLPSYDEHMAAQASQFAFLGTREAIQKLLNNSQIPLMPANIAKALIEGGIVTKSTDFAGMIGTTLNQMKADDLVERVEDGWKIKGKHTGFPISGNS